MSWLKWQPLRVLDCAKQPRLDSLLLKASCLPPSAADCRLIPRCSFIQEADTSRLWTHAHHRRPLRPPLIRGQGRSSCRGPALDVGSRRPSSSCKGTAKDASASGGETAQREPLARGDDLQGPSRPPRPADGAAGQRVHGQQAPSRHMRASVCDRAGMPWLRSSPGSTQPHAGHHQPSARRRPSALNNEAKSRYSLSSAEHKGKPSRMRMRRGEGRCLEMALHGRRQPRHARIDVGDGVSR